MFNSIIQKIGYIERKNRDSYIIFFNLKWTIVKDEKEITNQFNKTTSSHTQLSNNNCLKTLVKAGLLSLITNAIANILDTKLVAKSKTMKFDNNQNNLIKAFFVLQADKKQSQKKRSKSKLIRCSKTSQVFK